VHLILNATLSVRSRSINRWTPVFPSSPLMLDDSQPQIIVIIVLFHRVGKIECAPHGRIQTVCGWNRK